MIVATSLGLGLGVSYDPGLFQVLPASIYVLIENPICVGGVTAILMNLLLPRADRSEIEEVELTEQAEIASSEVP